MANTKRDVQYKQIRPGGDEITRTISNINESAADSTVAAFVSEVSNLSQNTLTAITDVKYEKLPINFDYVEVTESSTTIATASLQSSYIYNTGNKNTLVGGEVGDTLENTGASVRASLQGGDDSINNSGDFVSIYGGTGNNTVYNTGDSVRANLGDGNDTVYNTGDSVRANLGDGNDTVYNTGDSVLALLGSGDDTITNSGDYVTIKTSIGSNEITNTGDFVSINASLGSNEINNTGENVSILASSDTTINNTAQKYFVSIVGSGAFNNIDDIKFNDSNGDDSITNSGDNVSINSYFTSGGGNDTIINTGDNVRASLGSGDDFINNSGNYVTINAGFGDDSITNSGANVSINGYYGNNTIYNTGDNAVVSLGVGNDTVSLGGENTHVTLQFLGNYPESLNSVFGFDQTNHVIQIINSDTSISDTTINGGDDTRLILTKGSAKTTVDLYGVHEGSINVQFGDNEVTVYNLGGD